MQFQIKINNAITMFTSTQRDNRVFVYMSFPTYGHMYLHVFDMLNSFVYNEVPIGILLDYIEDNPEVMDIDWDYSISLIQPIRDYLQDSLWKTVKQIATSITINE